ncbi:MAG TPA: aminoacyl--tRNA ligase-related protein [Terriglobia bacterium]|nr:aminoacyl--tRNA ligase-related protein [Terriglobia bacterium]
MSQTTPQLENEARIDVRTLPDYRWDASGQSVLTGTLLELYRRIDNMFLRWAEECQASEYFFPTFVSAHELARLDYFRSFPHLVTFPAALDPAEDNLKRFADGAPLDGEGCVHLTALDSVRNVLTPAACYHFYIQFQGQTLDEARYVTTRATCFRRETHYLPLERQWNFSMREIVCIGTSDEVKAFLARYQKKADGFLKSINLPFEWKNATDPFFNPSRNPKFLAQKLDPVKTEIVFRTGLAIGSVNFHRNYFGEAFQINRDGQEAFSGCVAFGIERWIFAFLNHFGPNQKDWPDLNSI